MKVSGSGPRHRTISRQTIGEPVDTIGVLTYQFVPRRHQTRAARGVEARGAGRNPVGGPSWDADTGDADIAGARSPSFTLVVRPGVSDQPVRCPVFPAPARFPGFPESPSRRSRSSAMGQPLPSACGGRRMRWLCVP